MTGSPVRPNGVVRVWEGPSVMVSRRGVLLGTAAALAVPALPSSASGVVRPVVRSAALSLGALTTAVTHEQLLGVTWTAGSATVSARWLTPQGWTPWETAEDDSDAPEPDERAAAVPGCEPLWRPEGATLVELRTTGDARGLRLVRVTDGSAARGGLLGPAPASAAVGHRLLGTVRSRADWGCDESLRRGRPSYARAVSAVVVHHTAGRNGYAPSDVPAIIRADHAYHVRARGWSDLGYNLLVDRFGRVWEGRAGGLGRATVGSHAQGFNTGTLGVSVLGDYTRAPANGDIVRALGRVAAYAAATWRFDPTGRVTLTSGGSPRYRRGAQARLGRVFGHRETSTTACPGVLQDSLGSVRRHAAALLGPAPRIVEVSVSGAPVRAPLPVVVRARLSRTTPWRIAVRDASGRVLVNAAGTGPVARLEWDGLVPLVPGGPGVVPALPGEATWTVVADDEVHPEHRRTGRLRIGLPLVG